MEYIAPPLNPMESLVDLILQFGMIVIDLYIWCIFIYVILGWLFVLDFLQRHKRIFASKPHTWGSFEGFFRRIVEPVLVKIRRKVPRFGQLDLSPIILLLGLFFCLNILQNLRYMVLM